MPTIEVDTNALLRFTSLFENGIEKASADFSGLLLEAANYIEYLQRTGNEALMRIAELEQRLAETEQCLAVAEGKADGGPPGWTMVPAGKANPLNEESIWCHGGNLFKGTTTAYVRRMYAADGWVWSVWQPDHGYSYACGETDTAREAMSAAEAAYQEAIKGGHE